MNGGVGIDIPIENGRLYKDNLDDCYPDDAYHSNNISDEEEEINDVANDLEAFDGGILRTVLRILSLQSDKSSKTYDLKFFLQ